MKDETYVQICFTGGAIVLFIICASQSCSGIIIVRALGYTPNPTKLFEPTQVQSTHHHDVRTSHDK
jgi:predicted benzoate:H+ symporter BenE